MKIKVYKVKPSTNLNWHKEIKFHKCQHCGKLFYHKGYYRYCSDDCFAKGLRAYNAAWQKKNRRKAIDKA